MTNVLLFPRKAQPEIANGASSVDPAHTESGWHDGRGQLLSDHLTEGNLGLRAGLTGVIGLLEAALEEINPLLETIQDPQDRQALEIRIAIASLDVRRAKYNVSRLIDGSSR